MMIIKENKFYKKLLNIPNVLISSPEVTTKEWIDKSKFVSVISSSVGQEAVLWVNQF